jgi:hypothetical protein
MSRRLVTASLLWAWLCASGAMLDLTQLVAWTRMFAGYARTESVLAAAKETFDPGKPCRLCRAVSRAREACGRHGPAVPSAGAQRLVLIIERATPFIGLPAADDWPEEGLLKAPARSAEVPVPPPRGRSA